MMALLGACSHDQTPEGALLSGPMKKTEARELTNKEKAIGLRICYALQSKKSKLYTEYLGKNFKYQVTQKNCEGEKQNETFVGKLSEFNGQLQYSTRSIASSLTTPKILLGNSEGLALLCESLLSGKETFNTLGFHQYFFSTKKGADELLVNEIENDQVVKQFEFEFLTSLESDRNQIVGIEKHVTKRYLCPNRKISESTHTFVSVSE